ncbi:MAG TPA: DUF1236 domain-containing protein [Xanthobacteraceae bacterium]|nr:DUF1236 domain-containing protein [Xanthobacteraceae bacterium]
MRNHILATAFALAIMSPTLCYAQASTATGAVGGAAAGAIVGGPVGAVVGGTVGATVGAAAEPPREVRTYVLKEEVPSIAVKEKVVVGEPLPETVVLHPVPDHSDYAFAVVNNERVIVNPQTRKVITIVHQ